MFFDNLQVVHTRGRILEENHYYSYGLKIAGISSKAPGSLQNRYGYQGDFSEHDEETALDEFDLRHFDPQTGRWTTTDPYEQFANPYLGMGNSPVSNVDPDGGFKTRIGAWLYSIWNGGDVGKNKWGEFFVTDSYLGSAKEGIVVTLTFGKGRNALSSAAEALARDYTIMSDIRLNGKNSMYQMYDNSRQKGMAALGYVGLAMPSPILESGTAAANSGKVVGKTAGSTVNAGEKTVDVAAKGGTEAASVLSKGDLLRIENAATRINKPISVVGSRASGKAGAFSDWDYVIEGLNNKGWKQIKNSLPGSKSVMDNMPRNIDIFKGPVNINSPYITIYPR